jgi:hypothetical protein
MPGSRDAQTALAILPGLAGKIDEFVLVFRRDRAAQTTISLVVLTDLFFIALHALVRLADRTGAYPTAPDSRLLLTTEAGYAELFNYLQLAATACLIGGTFLRTRQAVYAALSAVFLVALGDDAAQLHERAGRLLARDAGLALLHGPGGDDLAQAAYWSAVGLVLAAVLLAGLAASRGEDRRIGLVLSAPVAALGLFAGFVDALHPLLASRAFPGSDMLLTLVEDGGELLSAAVALAAALLLHRHPDRLRGLSPAGARLATPTRPPRSWVIESLRERLR